MTQSGMENFHVKNATNFEKRKHTIHQMFHKLADPEDGLVVKSDLIDLIKEEGLFEDDYKMEQMVSSLEKNATLTTRGNCYKWTE